MKRPSLAYAQALAKVFGTDIAGLRAFLEAWGSRNRYLAGWAYFSRIVRDGEIRTAFREGASYEALARKHCLKVRTIRYIVHGRVSRKKAPDQAA